MAGASLILRPRKYTLNSISSFISIESIEVSPVIAGQLRLINRANQNDTRFLIPDDDRIASF